MAGRVKRETVDLTVGVADEREVAVSASTRRGGRKRKTAEGDGKSTPQKKKEKKVVEKRVGPDGRTVRWSAHASLKVRERIDRALPGSGHRMFLIDRKEFQPVGSEGGGVFEFAVLGATANVYSVTISRNPNCTCPDFLRGNLCKHILFVKLRVLKMAQTDPLLWQKALLTREVDGILRGFDCRVGDHSVLASDSVRERYKSLTKTDEGDGDKEGGKEDSQRRPIEGTTCPICFDDLEESGEALVWCYDCGNNLHKQCFKRWSAAKGAQVTCVYCRSRWRDGDNPDANVAGHKAGADDYVNLSTVSEHHTPESTSHSALYGARSVFLEADEGRMSIGRALNLFRASQGDI